MFLIRSCLRLYSSSTRRIEKMERFQSLKLTYNQESSTTQFSVDKYDVIGFDLDHTLCRYNLKPLFNFIYKSLSSFLIQKYDYPEELADLNELDVSFAQKGLILDKKRGNLLKLNDKHQIVRASHGTRMLSSQEILQRYGTDRVWEEAAKGIPQKLVLGSALQEPFYVFKDYFVTPGAAICAKMVNLLDAKGGESTEYSFWDHYLEGLIFIYDHQYFSAMRTEPGLYLRPCPNSVKNWLSNICSQKVTFLLTSANYDVADFLGEFCLGKDWKKYFDLVITSAGKPCFFWDKRPFCLVNSELEEAGAKFSEGSCVYSQGNFGELREKCAKLSKNEQPRIVYFGDSLIEDIYAASELAGCDTVAIVEELLSECPSPQWGSFFGDSQEGKSLWSRLLSEHSKLAIPYLEMISNPNLQEKSSCTPQSG